MIERVDMREITYLSDGLRVKGFVVAPKKAGRYPVLIWNRGGCRESVGVSTPYSVARWLSPFANWVMSWSPANTAARQAAKGRMSSAGRTSTTF